jgi:hypothetical protein
MGSRSLAKQSQSVLTANCDFAPPQLWLGRSYQQVGRLDGALPEFRQIEQSVHQWPVAKSGARVCHRLSAEAPLIVPIDVWRSVPITL